MSDLRRLHAVFFDLNNVIEDYESFAKNSIDVCAKVCVRHGIFSDYSVATRAVRKQLLFMKQHYGRFPYEFHHLFWNALMRQHQKEKWRFDLLNTVYSDFVTSYLKKTALYPDVMPTLRWLKGKFRLGLITNGTLERCYRFLEKFALEDYFDSILVSEETGFKKPDPFMFRYGLDEVRCPPNQALMVGDRYDTDISGAKGVGMLVCRLRRGAFKNQKHSSSEYQPDFELQSLDELRSILKKTFEKRKIAS